MIRGAALLALLAACFEPSYRCATDADCDLGDLPRCEATTQRCTTYDATCPVHRRYTALSGELSEHCYDDRIALENPCAGGQPPALPTGCAAAVCDALPACCDTGWSDACVQAAQLRCSELACDTRIAVTASSGTRTDLYDLRRAPGADTWTATRRDDLLTTLAWLPPAPGSLEPRLAGLTQTHLVAGDQRLPIDPNRTYHAITGVDLDRDGRDTVALAASFGTAPLRHAVIAVKLDGGASRVLELPRSQRLAWGDNDHDAFPDGVAGFNNGYSVLDNIEADTRDRTLDVTTSSTVNAQDTPPLPPITGFDWIDLDRDGRLDLAVFGTQVRIHTGDTRLANTPVFNRDCDPLVTANNCDQPAEVAFAGTGLPDLDQPAVIVATFPDRAIYRVELVSPTLVNITPVADGCPTCRPLLALVARDLDGDHRLDLVGLDSALHVHTALARDGYRFVESTPLPAPPLPTTYSSVALSASGAPSP